MRLASCTLLAALVARRIDAQDSRAVLEVGGVRAGMTLSEARQGLSRMGPGAAAFEPKTATQREMLGTFYPYEYSGGTANDVVTFTLSLPPAPPRVTEIRRIASYPDGKGPSRAGLIQAMKEKYGPPSFLEEHPVRTYVYWAFDGGVMPKARAAQCGAARRYHDSPGLALDPKQDSSGLVQWEGTCRRFVRAEVSTQWNPEVVSGLEILAVDAPAYAASARAFGRHILALREQRKAREAQEAAKRSVKCCE